ncbi:MAG: DUF2269 family protein [Chloroflexota bacterium]|nr:DUF2269 family protein [Chloroflexota bacterium]
MFLAFKFLHILTMFAAVSAAVIPEVVYQSLARRRNFAALRSMAPVVERAGKMIPVLFVLGLVFGLIAAFTGSLNFLAPWLIAAYVVFLIAMVTGAAVSGPWAQRVAKAASASEPTAPSAELEAALADPRGLVSSAILMGSIVVIIFLMVIKPLS